MAESEMIERVARAICRAEYGPGDAGWENQIPAARAAIEAMREPTGDMVEGLAVTFDLSEQAVLLFWRQMIDAALSPSTKD
jgi:hypothetical protein